MSQELRYWIGDLEHIRYLPDADSEVVKNVRWGEPWALFTPAYWLSQFWMAGLGDAECSPYHARGGLAEEVVFCMLGGFGITAELATAAFEKCKDEGLISRLEVNVEPWVKLLQQPLHVNGRVQRYRYPNQKARYIAAAMGYLRNNALEHCSGRKLRDALLEVDGIGPKTAGWIARNYADADDVAILDIHLIRACTICGIFTPEHRVERDYMIMEDKFLSFCRALDVRPAVIDCLIWDQMRALGSLALDVYQRAVTKEKPQKTIGKQRLLPYQMNLFA